MENIVGKIPGDKLIFRLLKSFNDNEQCPAIAIENQSVTYSQLLDEAFRYCTQIRQIVKKDDKFIGVFAHRSLPLFAGLFGVLFSGLGYVPLSRTLPLERTKKIILLSGIDTLIVDRLSMRQLPELLSGINRNFTIIVEDEAVLSQYQVKLSPHKIAALSGKNFRKEICFEDFSDDNNAYMMFTSGTTGEPKGVVVRHSNILNYVDNLSGLCNPRCGDRFSHVHIHTFDFSIHDIFLCCVNGGCLCVVSDNYLLMPGPFIKERELTFWSSVPSTVSVMQRYGMLKEDMYPSLQWSFFCGAPLTHSLAAEWHKAAPNSRIINLYGPTEATVACTWYEWMPEKSIRESINGIVPIGQPFENMHLFVVDKDLRIVSAGTEGELCLSGAQVVDSYWNAPEITREKFVEISDQGTSFSCYRTGDVVIYNDAYGFNYISRMDDQLKILGYRVELQEIESVVTDIVGSTNVVAVAWPVTASGAEGIYAFVSGVNMDKKTIIDRCRKILPSYMVPKDIIYIDVMPLNINNKVDKKKLIHLLEGSGN